MTDKGPCEKLLDAMLVSADDPATMVWLECFRSRAVQCDKSPDDKDRDYIEGNRAAWRMLLVQCLGELGHEATDAAVAHARAVAHLEATRAELRRVCEEFGDNDWPDELHLADVVEKHLRTHLHELFR